LFLPSRFICCSAGMVTLASMAFSCSPFPGSAASCRRGGARPHVLASNLTLLRQSQRHDIWPRPTPTPPLRGGAICCTEMCAYPSHKGEGRSHPHVTFLT